MANPFVHIELQSNNLPLAKDFYRSLFDWKLEDAPGMDYTMIDVGEGTGGGMMRNPLPESTKGGNTYEQLIQVHAAFEERCGLPASGSPVGPDLPGTGLLAG